MPRSSRYIGAALAGLGALICAFGVGAYVGVLNYPQEQRYQPYRYAPDKPEEIDPALAGQANPHALEKRQPCADPKGRDESDLCAQWKAARAAESGALWTKLTFFLGLIGVLVTAIGTALLLRSIKQGDAALLEAKKANQIARDEIDAANRPWLDVTATISALPYITGENLVVPIAINITNFGNQFAKGIDIFAIAINQLMGASAARQQKEIANFRTGLFSSGIVAPNNPVSTSRNLEIPLSESADLGGRRAMMIAIPVIVRYETVSGVEKMTHKTFMVHFPKIPGTKALFVDELPTDMATIGLRYWLDGFNAT